MKAAVYTVILFIFISLSIMAEQPEKISYGPNFLKSNPDVMTYQTNDRGIPRYVEGNLSGPAKSGDVVAEALDFFENNRGAYKMANPAEELMVERTDVDDLGMSHVRFNQYYEGVKVVGGVLIAHFSADNRLKTVNGTYIDMLNIDTKPNLAQDEAVKTAADDLLSFFGAGEPATPELVVFPWEGQNYLCWRLFIYSDTPMGRWEYLVDAGSGEIVFKANRIMDVDVWGSGISVMGDARDWLDISYTSGTYYMIDYTRQLNNNVHGHNGQMPSGNYIQTNIAGSSLPGSVATDADNYWDVATSQRPAVDGHTYTGLMYDYMLNTFNRNGYNGNGATMLTSVNYSAEGDNNAYWNGSQIVIWSWSTGWRSLAACPDVIAHEWGHAITEYCSDLVYQKEPGALNESFSDMIGAAFEFAYDSLDTPDWLMGENGRTTGEGFRSMSDPHVYGDPDYYGTSDPYWVNVVGCTPSWYNDYCGVHTNSGVGNKWFFLLSDGGVHHGITVSGIGVRYAIKIADRANAFYWN
ncbi:MAG: M4 family metallopeptidase, partial [Candidatus Zixiibacteriota bacterium]